MPNVWIEKNVYSRYVNEHGGINQADEAIQETVAENAPGEGDESE